RPAPYIDRTLYTGWVALVASGYLAAARFARVEHAAAPALRALDRIARDSLTGDGVLHRVGDPSSGIHVDDQAHTLNAFLDAFEHSQDERWLEHAMSLASVLRTRFRDP